MPKGTSTSSVNPNYSQVPITRKGFLEILEGQGIDNPQISAPDGIGTPTYAQRSPTDILPSRVVLSDRAGGITTEAAERYAQQQDELSNNLSDLAYIMSNTNIPQGFDHASGWNYFKKVVKSGAKGAWEEIAGTGNALKDLVAGEGYYADAIKSTVADRNWHNALGWAYGKEPELASKMPTLQYQKDDGLVGLDQMSISDIAYSRVDRWKNADGSEMSDLQKRLLEDYKKLNLTRIDEQTSNHARELFGEELSEKLGLLGSESDHTLGDFNTKPVQYAEIIGSVAGSFVEYGYGGTATRVAASGATKGAGKLAEKALKSKYMAAKFFKREGGSKFAAYRKFLNTRNARIKSVRKSVASLAAINSTLTGYGTVGGMSFLREYSDIKAQALAKGMDFSRASEMAMWAASGEAGLEMVAFKPITKFLTTRPSFRNLIFGATVPEGMQEASQTLNENIWTQAYGLTDKQFADVAAETLTAFMLGSLGGLAGGLLHLRSAQNEAMETKLQAIYGAQNNGKNKRRENPFNFAKNANFNGDGFTSTPGQTQNLNNSIAWQHIESHKDEKGNDVHSFKTANIVDGQGTVIGYTGVRTDNYGRPVSKFAIFPDSSRGVETAGGPQEQIAYQEAEIAGLLPQPTTEELSSQSKFNDLTDSNPEDASALYSYPEGSNYHVEPLTEPTHDVLEALPAEEIQVGSEESKKLDEGMLKDAKEYFMGRLDAIDPDMDEKKKEQYWNMARRALVHEWRTGDFSKAIIRTADSMMSMIEGKQERFRKNADEINSLLSDLIPPDKMEQLLSDDPTTRYNAEWDVVTNLIISSFGPAHKKEGTIVALNFRNLFYGPLMAEGEATPLELYESVKLTFVSVTAADLRGQKIGPFQSFVDEIKNRVDDIEDPAEARDTTHRILQDFMRFKNTGSDEDKKELKTRIFQALFGEVSEDKDVNDVYNYIQRRGEIESALAHEMGTDAGNNLSMMDYQSMALMRMMGFNQLDINKAYGIVQKNSNQRYKQALDKLYPELTKEQLADLNAMVGEAAQENEGNIKNVEGFYKQGSNTAVVVSDSPVVAIEEGMHWVYDVMSRLSKADAAISHAIVDNITSNPTYARQTRAQIKPTPRRTMMAINTRLREVISTRNGTLPQNVSDNEVKEMWVSTFFDWLAGNSENSSAKELGLQDLYYQLLNDYSSQAASPNPLYAGLSKAKKGKAISAVEQMFGSAEPMKLMKLAKDVSDIAFNGKSKEDIGGKLMELFHNKSIPNELGTPATLQKALSDPQTSLGDIANIAFRIADNAKAQALREILANTINKISLDENDGSIKVTFDNDGNRKLESIAENEIERQAENGTDTSLLYSRKGDKLQPELARQGKDLQTLAKETIDPLKPKSVAKAFRTLMQPISHAAKALHSSVYGAIERLAMEKGQRDVYAELLEGQAAMLFKQHNDKAAAGDGEYITKEQYEVFSKTLFNGKRDAADQWVIKHFTGAEEQKAMLDIVHEYQTAFDQSLVELERLGVKLIKIDGYWPRIVENQDGLVQLLGHPVPGTQLDKMIRDMKESGMSDADIINAISTEFRRNQGEKEVEMFHKRVIRDVTLDMVPFYKDPFSSATQYLKAVSDTIFMREMVGDIQFDNIAEVEINGKKQKIKKPRWGETGIISSLLYGIHEGKMGEFNAESFDEFVERLKQLQKREATDSDFWSAIKAMQGVFALGSIRSTVNQLLELVPMLYRYGLGAVSDAAIETLNDKGIATIEDIGVAPLNEVRRIDQKGFWPELQSMILQATGFSKMDVFLKNMTINAAYIKARNTIASGLVDTSDYKRLDRQLESLFSDSVYGRKDKDGNIFNPKKMQVMQDIKDGKLTKDVMLFLRSSIAQTQPIDAVEVAAGYNAAGPFGKLCYYLMNTQMKQTQFLIDEFREEYKTGGAPGAAKAMARFLIFALMVGIPQETLAAIIAFRKPEIIPAAIYSPAQFFFINEYLVSNAKQRGIASAVFGQMAPGWKAADMVSRDLFNLVSGKEWKGNSLKLLPVAPELAYNTIGGGKEQLKRQHEYLGDVFSDNDRFFSNVEFFGGTRWY